MDFIPSPSFRIFVYNLAASLCLSLQDLMPSSLRTTQKESWRWLWLLSLWSPRNQTPDQLTLGQEPFANDELFSGGRASEMTFQVLPWSCYGVRTTWILLPKMSLLMMTIEATRLLQAQSSSSRRMAVGCQEIRVVEWLLLILLWYCSACTRVSLIRFQFDKHRKVASFCF